MKFDANPEALAGLVRDPKVKAALTDAAQQVADLTVGNARIRRYGPACEVEDTQDGVRVWRTEPFASIDEWGSKNGPPSAAMRRAVQQAGLRFNESPKP